MKKVLYFCLIICIAAIAGGCRTINGTTPELRTDKQEVLLTFDDGPNAHGDTTARLLDILKKHDIRAVFVLLGENAEKNPALVRRIYAEGHIIANHGYADKWAVNMSDGEFRENLLKGEAAIAAAAGEMPIGEATEGRFYRPHGGYYLKRHEHIWREQGWTMIKCDIRAFDAAKSESEKQKVVRQIVKKTEQNKGGIILLHDSRGSWVNAESALAKTPSGPYNRGWLPAAVEEIIVVLLAKGYRFSCPVQ